MGLVGTEQHPGSGGLSQVVIEDATTAYRLRTLELPTTLDLNALALRQVGGHIRPVRSTWGMLFRPVAAATSAV